MKRILYPVRQLLSPGMMFVAALGVCIEAQNAQIIAVSYLTTSGTLVFWLAFALGYLTLILHQCKSYVKLAKKEQQKAFEEALRRAEEAKRRSRGSVGS